MQISSGDKKIHYHLSHSCTKHHYLHTLYMCILHGLYYTHCIQCTELHVHVMYLIQAVKKVPGYLFKLNLSKFSHALVAQ